MFKNQKLTLVFLFVLLAGFGNYALASGSGSTGSAGSGTSPGVTSDGITGTDPEPISPTIVTIVLTLVNLG